jgi:nitrogen regulatory protein P-II 1
MKRIESVIVPFKLDEVLEELTAIGVRGVTVVEAKGFGGSRGRGEFYRGSEYEVKQLPYVMLIVYASDQMTPLIVETIRTSARTDKSLGNGLVAVVDLDQAFHIRTDQEGEMAL